MTDIILPTLCSCGHAEGYHHLVAVEFGAAGTPREGNRREIWECKVWACYCTGYEGAAET